MHVIFDFIFKDVHMCMLFLIFGWPLDQFGVGSVVISAVIFKDVPMCMLFSIFQKLFIFSSTGIVVPALTLPLSVPRVCSILFSDLYYHRSEGCPNRFHNRSVRVDSMTGVAGGARVGFWRASQFLK